MATATGGVSVTTIASCACCGEAASVTEGWWVQRPALALAGRPWTVVERITAWLERAPASVFLCPPCARSRLPASGDLRVRRAAGAKLFFDLFGHPSLAGRADWRPPVRTPIAWVARAPQPLWPRGRETKRGLRRWIKLQRAWRRRLRKRAAQFFARAVRRRGELRR